MTRYVFNIILLVVLASCTAIGQVTTFYKEQGFSLNLKGFALTAIDSSMSVVTIPKQAISAKRFDHAGRTYSLPLLKVAVPESGMIRFVPRFFVNGKPRPGQEVVLKRTTGRNDRQSSPARFSVDAEVLGIQRGVTIALLTVNPLETSSGNSLILADSVVVDVEMTQSQTSKRTKQAYDADFLNVVNSLDIEAMRRGSTRDLTNGVAPPASALQAREDIWFVPGQDYLRLDVSDDAVTLLPASHIVAAMPSMAGLDKSSLRLLHRGKPYPCAWLAGDQGALTMQDTLVFAGRRAAGDTTWLDYKAETNPYFLANAPTLDHPSLVLVQQGRPAAATQVDGSVVLNVERDVHYHWGDDDAYLSKPDGQYNTELQVGKGFFWKALFAGTQDSMQEIPFTFFPAQDTSLIRIDLRYRTAKRLQDSVEDYDVTFRINGTTYANKKSLALQFDTLTAWVPPSALVAGVNIAEVSFKSATNANLFVLTDYLRISGNANVLTAFSGSYRPLSDPSQPALAVVTKLGEPLVAIDTAAGEFYRDRGQRGSFVSASWIGARKFWSIAVNDSLVSGNDALLHRLVVTQPALANPQLVSGKSEDIAKSLENLSAGSTVAFVASPGLGLEERLLARLRSLGARQTDRIRLNSSYVFIAVVGEANSREFVGENAANVSVQGFLYHSAGMMSSMVLHTAQGSPRNDIVTSMGTSTQIPGLTVVRASDELVQPVQTDVVVLTHRKFRGAADSLAAYRRSQGHTVTVFDIEEVFLRYSYGRKSVESMKDFLRSFYQSALVPKPRYLILFGNASRDSRNLLPGSIGRDYVPTFGFPTSDFWFGLLDGDDYIPELIVGRLSVSSLEEGLNVVEKIKKYEALEPALWMRRILYLTGGGSQMEAQAFAESFENSREYVVNPPLCADTIRIRSKVSSLVSQTQALQIRSTINEGVGINTFFGHGAPQFFDLDGWHARDLNNGGREFWLLTFSCQSGAYADPGGDCRNEEYVFAKDKGAIAATGNTGTGELSIDNLLYFRLGLLLAEDTTRRIGDFLYKMKEGFYGAQNAVNSSMQYSLIGDPLTQLAFRSKPEFFLDPSTVQVSNDKFETTLTEADSVALVRVPIGSSGIGGYSQFEVRCIRTYAVATDTFTAKIYSPCRPGLAEFAIPINGQVGQHRLVVEIDPDSSLGEETRRNNRITASFAVFPGGIVPVEPLPNQVISAGLPKFRFLPLRRSEGLQYNVRIVRSLDSLVVTEDNSFENQTSFDVREAFVDWTPNRELDPNTFYRMEVQSVDLIGRTSQTLVVPFSTGPEVLGPSIMQLSGVPTMMANVAAPALVVKEEGGRIGIGLPTDTLRLHLESCNYSDGFRTGVIRIDTTNVVPVPELSRFNLLHVKAGGGRWVYRDFETYYDNDTWSIRVGDCSDLLTYIFDSVEKGDVVAVALTNIALNAFRLDSGVCDLASFELALRSLGARLADSVRLIRDRQPNLFPTMSYVMIGEKGKAVGTALESWTADLDTLVLNAEYVTTAYSLRTSTDWFGPAKRWQDLRIDRKELDLTGRLTVLGKRAEFGPIDTLIRDVTELTSNHGDSLAGYPWIRADLSLERDYGTGSGTLFGVSAVFEPLPEITLLPPANPMQAEAMRGDSVEFSVRYINISPEVAISADSIVATWRSDLGAGASGSRSVAVGLIPNNDSALVALRIPSNQLSSDTRVVFSSVAADRSHDMYSFNNRAEGQARVREDSIKPWVRVYADRAEVFAGSWVRPSPDLTIELYDNSRLPIDSTKLRVRLNTQWLPDSHAIARFESVGDHPTMRAVLTISGMASMQEGENLLVVFFEDASANRDTLRIRLRVSRDGAIENLVVFPQPSPGNTQLRFTYRGEEHSAPCVVDVYNSGGILVSRQTYNLRIGQNTIEWRGEDNAGAPLESGPYYFVMRPRTNFYVAPVYGKILLFR